MFFSVIIPVYNRPHLIKRAIESVLQQTYQHFELIVVDDGSTDITPDVIRGYDDRLIFLRQEHAGVSAARNLGIQQAQGEYIALLDSDDSWLPRKLEAHVQYLARFPEVRIHQSEEIWMRNGKRVNPKVKHRKPEGDIFLPSLELCLVSPSAVIIHSDIFSEYGLFDEQMSVCEDYDLWLRIARSEYVGLLSEPLIIKYGGHEDQLSHKEWGMDRFRVYAMLKLYNAFSGELHPTQKKFLEQAISRKCRILQSGAEKRGNRELYLIVQSVQQALSIRNSSKIDYSALLRV